MRYLILLFLFSCQALPAGEPTPSGDLPRNGVYSAPYQWEEFCEENPKDPACETEE